jgi:rhodanese-related sulfurtransferase
MKVGRKMKKLLVLLMVAIMAFMTFGCSAGGSIEKSANNYFAEFPGARIIEWKDLFAKIDAGDEPYILSIRQNDVYTEGHIKGAYLASWGEDLAEKVAMLPTDKPVYVYCYSGQTAGQAIALMNLLGVEAYSVKSGFNYGAMKTEGYEEYVETTANEMPDAGAKFDKKALDFVKEYFNTVNDNKSNIIAADAAKPLIEAGDLVVMDIRKAEDYEKAHIDGAINVPFGMDMQKKFVDFKDKKILVACYSGQTAGQTVGILRALGYDAVSLKFGMGQNGWANFVKTSAANKYFAEYPGSRIISWEDIFAKMDAGEELNILSIRQPEDYEKGHIKGAALAAWGPDLAEKVSMLPTDKPVYVYCYSGQTAGQAVALLNMLGIEAYSIKSGYNKGAAIIDGYAAYTTTDVTELEDAGAKFDNVLLAEVQTYFDAVLDSADFKIGWDDTKAAVEAKEATVVDIRTAEDFAAGHIQDAINIPFGENMQEKFADLPEGKLIVACYSGQTAGQTTAVLRMLGHDAVSLHFGMKVGWIKEGYPVVTD